MSKRKPHGYWKRIAADMEAQSVKKVVTRSEANGLAGAIIRMDGLASMRKLVDGYIVIRIA